MFKNEEEKLNEYKKMYDQIPISIESLDQAILAGFQKAKVEEKRKPSRKKWMYSLTAAAILLIGFFTSIRMSPAFADYITVIPGMEKVVELIRYDKGMMSAIENDYYQPIGAFEENKGLKVTIDGAIADESGMVLFYTLESNEKVKELYIDKAIIESLNGEKLDLSSISYGSSHFSQEGERSYHGTLDYFFKKPIKLGEYKLNLQLKGDIESSYTIPFTLNKEMQTKKTYQINKTVEIEGQKMTFLTATVQPLRVAVHLKMDPNNTKKILEFKDLRLVDENGEAWNKNTNGTSASRISDDEEIIYLQSNYFRKPKELYLVMDKLQAIDKAEKYVVVDTEKQQILKQPKGEILKSVKVSGDHLDFTMKNGEDFPYFVFGKIMDGNGTEIHPETSYFSGIGEQEIEKEFGVQIANLKNQKGPLSFEISFFPAWIEGKVKVKLK
ncbi:DUF4179 domain-containing protein [Neobacillus sp. D3-1R]|uniref:DUF4179 domain-containing protein n=1 Tax=Neobacillus sp. D3-1R TaxID=3445778 RepID=UPI003FA10291